MKLKYKAILPFAISLLSHLQGAINEVERKGIDVDKDEFFLFVSSKIDNWNPEILGAKILDPETKQHAVHFIGGIALNIMRGRK